MLPLFLAPWLALAQPAAVTPPDIDRVLERFDDLYRSDASIARMRLTVVTAKTTRSLEMKAWSKGDEKMLVVVESPAREAGTSTLKVGDNLWNYFPRIARTIRVPPSMMLGSWMGSDFTNDDLVHEGSYEDDYESEIVGRSAEPPGWRIVSKAKPGVVGLWERIEWVIDDEEIPLHFEFYDRRGRLARTMTYSGVKTMDGRRIPTKLVLQPVDDRRKRTEMEYVDVDFDAKVPDDTFSLSRLERAE